MAETCYTLFSRQPFPSCVVYTTYMTTRTIDWDLVLRLYLEGTSIKAIAEEAGCKPSTVHVIRRRSGIPVREPRRRWAFNQRFFEKIDNEESAYWLGFLLADGSVSKRGFCEVGLQAGDSGHLRKLTEALGSSQPIRLTQTPHTRKDGTSISYHKCSIRLGSRRMVDDLRVLGVTERKSLREVAPISSIPCELRRHFWRGVIDGDGCIWARKGRNPLIPPSPSIELVGSQMLCSQFRDFALEHCAFSSKVREGPEGVFRFKLSRKVAVHRLLEVLYGNSTVYLDRKYQAAHQWGFAPEYYYGPGGRAKLSHSDVLEIRELVREGETQLSIARSKGVSTSCINHIVSGRTWAKPPGSRQGPQHDQEVL